MIMEKERKQLINYGKKLVIEKLTKGTFCIKTSEGVDEYKFELE